MYKSVNGIRSLAVLATLTIASSGFGYQQPADKSVPPDNTKVNKRDRNSGAATAGQQSNSKTDRELTRNIRRAIVDDKSLSTYAHNIKIITRNGEVTLKGPVRTEEEKKAVEAKAAEAAGGATINSKIEVAPRK